jgi:cytoplasmic iron level regulating protein YaaA (DUF328/UPF0246 family)
MCPHPRDRYLQAVPRRTFVLIPPSEAKSEGGRATRRVDEFADALGPTRSAVSELLARHMTRRGVDLSRTFKARGELLERCIVANQHAVSDRGPFEVAWRRYRGVVWTHLDPATMTPAQRRRILVPSALYGLNVATDEIADYRLAMNASLVGGVSLANLWRESLSEALASHCAGANVVNLLTHEFDAAIDVERLSSVAKVTAVQFVSADGSRSVGHDAKAVKGALASAVVRGGVSSVDGFEWRGWRALREGSVVRVVAPLERVVL